MKLMTVIIQDKDSDKVLEALVGMGFSVTRVASTGGFLQKGNVTLLIGLEAMEASIEKSANRLSIAIIIASILIGSALLLLAKTPPLVFGIPLLGLAGFLVALVMSFALIFSIYKQGRL